LPNEGSQFSAGSVWQPIACNVDVKSLEGQQLTNKLATLEKVLKPGLGASWDQYVAAEQRKFGSGICQQKLDARQETLTALHSLSAPQP
jgi:hypothetical protein